MAACVLVLAAGCGRVQFDERSETAGDASSTLALVLEPPTATINMGSKLQLTASGGVPPYTFDVLGGGWIDPAVGLFVAPSRVGTSTVRVTDAASATATAEVMYGGSTIFLAGGLVGGASVTEVRASSDGLTWNVVGALPAPRANGSLVVFDDRLLYLGGNNAGVPQPTIYASTDGASWMLVGMLPDRVVSAAVTVHAGALWLISGYEGTVDHPEVLRSTDGVTWTNAGMFPTPRHEHDVISRDDRLVVLGGHGAIEYTDIVSSIDGATWTTSPTTLSFATDFQGGGELGDTVVRSCGQSCSTVEASSDLTNWATGTLPDGTREGPSIVNAGGRLLLFGGGRTSILASTDGIAWSVVGTLPVTISRGSATVFTPR